MHGNYSQGVDHAIPVGNSSWSFLFSIDILVRMVSAQSSGGSAMFERQSSVRLRRQNMPATKEWAAFADSSWDVTPGQRGGGATLDPAMRTKMEGGVRT
jgi:hypothetical protein